MQTTYPINAEESLRLEFVAAMPERCLCGPFRYPNLEYLIMTMKVIIRQLVAVEQRTRHAWACGGAGLNSGAD
jgi:hypothetical protein